MGSLVTRFWLLFSCFWIPLLCQKGSLTAHGFTGTYGINYGRIADNLPSPETVITLLRAAKIKNVRIYDFDPSVLKAFEGSGIELNVGLPNGYLKEMSLNEVNAMNWVKENVQPFLPGTHIRGIAVGNEILAGGNEEMEEVLYGAVRNVYTAIERLGLTDVVEVNTPHSEAVFANSYPPSSCIFKESIRSRMKLLLEFFSKTGAPFYINAYPFLAYKSDPEHIDIRYALFESNPGIYDAKTKLHYDNMFDAQVDAAYAALEAAGYGDMEVRVSETGWASNGDSDEAGATVENARTYNFNLRKRLAKKKGTPLRPKREVKAYVFALFNENMKPGKGSERHFGLYEPNGSIAYDIGFPGLESSSAASRKYISFRGFKKASSSQGFCNMVLVTSFTVMLLILTR